MLAGKKNLMDNYHKLISSVKQKEQFQTGKAEVSPRSAASEEMDGTGKIASDGKTEKINRTVETDNNRPADNMKKSDSNGDNVNRINSCDVHKAGTASIGTRKGSICNNSSNLSELDEVSLLNGIILSEVLAKPKCKRRGR